MLLVLLTAGGLGDLTTVNGDDETMENDRFVPILAGNNPA